MNSEMLYSQIMWKLNARHKIIKCLDCLDANWQRLRHESFECKKGKNTPHIEKLGKDEHFSVQL